MFLSLQTYQMLWGYQTLRKPSELQKWLETSEQSEQHEKLQDISHCSDRSDPAAAYLR